MEDPVYTVLIIGCCEDVADNELPGPSHNDRVVSEVCVLEQDTSVFLVDADRILDGDRSTSSVDKFGVHIVDTALAVAAQA